MSMQRQKAIIEETPSKVIQSDSSQGALDFVSIGVGCFALTLIQNVGIISSLVEDGHFDDEKLKNKKSLRIFQLLKQPSFRFVSAMY